MSILSILLHPAAQLAFVATQLYCLLYVNLVFRMVLTALFVVLYILLVPNTTRGSWGWRSVQCPLPVLSDRDVLRQKDKPVLVISYAMTGEGALSSWNHALAFGHRFFSNSVVMVSGTTTFGKLPLARLVLWLAGGLMPYTRGALIYLLKRRGNVIVVSQTVGTDGKITLAKKGVFSAALRTGATIVPALVLPDGSVVVGKGRPTEVVSVPTPDEVVTLARTHAKQVIDLSAEHKKTVSLVNV